MLEFFMKGSRVLFTGKSSCHVHCDCRSGSNLPVGRQIAQVSRVYLQTAFLTAMQRREQLLLERLFLFQSKKEALSIIYDFHLVAVQNKMH